ncbi:MAG: hypothetical protein AAF458_01875 [Pseudomonadota bacterium]
MHSHFIQFVDATGARRVGSLDLHGNLATLRATDSIYALAERAISESTTLDALAQEFAGEREVAEVALAGATLLGGADHPVDEARCTLWDLSGGVRCLGDGSGLASPRRPHPATARTETLTAALCGAYLIDGHQQPRRLGFGLALFGGPFSGFAFGPALFPGTEEWLEADGSRLEIAASGVDTSQTHIGLTDNAAIAESEGRLFRQPQCRRTADLHIAALTAVSLGAARAELASVATRLSHLPLELALTTAAEPEVRTRAL